ncbi:MAG: ATP-binding protein [Acidobacteria bacterium]|nr:ATP-binding protein [Acidobacteriota bacterium]MCZ6832501.1 ATP-binding protein [Acidobacteriota bacterium]
MTTIRQFLKRHPAWVAAVLAILPLILLFRLQYVSLLRLEETSGIAQRATLQTYLEALANEFEYEFKIHAERVLNIPASYFLQGRMEKLAYLFTKKNVKGARHLFVINYALMKEGDTEGDLYIFDAVNWSERATQEEINAVLVAVAPWKLMAERNIPLVTVPLSVDERDPDNRMILNPITEDSRVVGVAGMILDNEYFAREILGPTIEHFLAKLYGKDLSKSLRVTVRNEQGRRIYGAKAPASLQDRREVRRGFDFIYTDWTLDLRSTSVTEGEWARSNFVINLSLSAVLSIMLLGGLVVALRAVARESKLNQMKSDFVSNVSHELRTPLASIRVFSEFLRLGRARDAGKVVEYGEYIETESRRLTLLINNLLDFAKIESGSKTYEFVSGDLEVVLAECLRTFAVRLSHGGREIRYDKPRETLPPVRMDADALVQAFCNILENADKYSKNSAPIHVTLKAHKGEVIVGVRDEGVGIARTEQKRIFERFHRVSTGLVHEVKGTGLGLAIVKHVVDAHGGRVTVRSEAGKGSTFAIHLPALDPEEEPIREGAAPHPSPS